jgi:hypothetical protein
VTWLGAAAGVGAEVAGWLELELLELELLELEAPEPSSPAGDDEPETLAGEADPFPEVVAEWVGPGRVKATTPAVVSPARPTAVVVPRIRCRPRCRAAAAASRSRLLWSIRVVSRSSHSARWYWT